MKRIDRTGEIFYDSCGVKGEIIIYNSCDDLWVTYDNCPNGELIHSKYYAIKSKQIASPYNVTLYNKGYIGYGNFKTKENGKSTKEYYTWNNMLKRCYSEEFKEKEPTYKDVICCDEWHCFQNFAKWFNENYYEINGERMELDKDILHKGNKIYSPENCIFVPRTINVLFTKRNKSRGNLPIGVTLNKSNNKYICQCSIKEDSNVYRGIFSSKEEAYNFYKKIKEQEIKKIANYYKDIIPTKLYRAMLNYKVEITD